MSSILNLFRDIIYKLRSTRGFVRLFIRRWVLFLAFLGRRLGVWRPGPWDNRKRCSFPKAEQTQALATRSASHPSLHYMSRATREPQLQSPTASDTPHIPAANLTVEPLSHRDHVNPSSVFDARIDLNRRSTGDSSIRRRSSDRPSIMQTHSRESLPMPVSQPTQFPRAPHRHFGRGPSVSLSRTSSRSPSPTPQLPRFEIDVTNPHQVDRRDSPIHPPSVTSHGHTQPSPPSIRGQDRRQSSTSVVVGVVNPSTDSLPAPPRILTDGPPLTEEPYAIDSPTDHLSVPDTLDLREGLPQYSPTSSSSSVTSNFDPPAGRSLQLITPEQVPRYTKDVTVPRESTDYEIPPLTRTFPQLTTWKIAHTGCRPHIQMAPFTSSTKKECACAC
ncbi:hypothetical protein EDB89DRAFT_340621 [Lactarius sanguifluus]|nr:hypothetical protein EDB89DRAFT_340621 [Lactarius sanguifluus]